MDWPYKKKKCVQKLRDSVFYDGRSRRTNFSCGFLRIFFFFFLLREKQQKSRPIRRGIFHWLDRRRLRARGTGASGRFLAQWPQGAHQADCVHFFVSFVFRHFCWRRAFVSLSLSAESSCRLDPVLRICIPRENDLAIGNENLRLRHSAFSGASTWPAKVALLLPDTLFLLVWLQIRQAHT